MGSITCSDASHQTENWELRSTKSHEFKLTRVIRLQSEPIANVVRRRCKAICGANGFQFKHRTSIIVLPFRDAREIGTETLCACYHVSIVSRLTVYEDDHQGRNTLKRNFQIPPRRNLHDCRLRMLEYEEWAERQELGFRHLPVAHDRYLTISLAARVQRITVTNSSLASCETKSRL